MKIGQYEISLTRRSTAEKKPKANTTELGGSGTTIYGGMISDVEYNPKLNTEYGMGGLSIFDQMRKSDPIVKQSLLIVTLPIIQAEWVLEEPENEPQAEEIHAFVKEALFQRMERSFPDVVREILTYLPFGFSVFEKVFKIEDNKVWLKKLAMRTQKSIVKFEAEKGQFGVTQQLTGERNEQVKIPGEKLLVFTHEREGDNYRGVSILRSAYKPWYFKEAIEKIDAISFERHGVGVPVFKQPKSAKPIDVEKAKEIGENLRANEKAYILLPFDWEVDILKGPQASDGTDKVKRYNREILSNVLAQFLDLGATSSGSRSLSQDHSDAFFKSEQANADYVAEIINDHLIPQLVDLNFDNVKNYPRLSATGIQKIDMSVFATAIQNLVSAKLLSIDTEFEEFIRKTFGLPEMSEELKDQKEEELKAQAEFKKNNPFFDPSQNNNNSNATDNNDNKNKSNVKSNVNSDEDDDEEVTQQTKEALELSKSFKEVCDCGHHNFNDEMTFFRPLTFAEKRIDIKGISKALDELEIMFADELTEIIESELAQLLARVRVALRMNDILRLEELFSQFRFEVEQVLRDQINRSLELGKRTASQSLKVPLTQTPSEVSEAMSARISSIAQKMSQDLTSQVKLNALQHLQLQTPVNSAISSIRGNAEKLVRRQVLSSSSDTLMGGFNTGRDIVFQANEEKIHSLTRSEVLDRKICNYCLSVDGRTVEVSDPIAKQNQFHFLCRGIWVETLKDQSELPEITGIPENLRQRVGSLTDFKQLKKPEPLEGGLAEEFVIANKRQ